MDKDTGLLRSGRAMAWACAAVLAAPAAAAEPYDAAWCETLTALAHDMAEMRMDGLTQAQAAGRAADRIAQAVNTAPLSGRERRAVADALAPAATKILRFVYSVPLPPQDEPFSFRVGAFIYGLCAAGDL